MYVANCSSQLLQPNLSFFLPLPTTSSPTLRPRSVQQLNLVYFCKNMRIHPCDICSLSPRLGTRTRRQQRMDIFFQGPSGLHRSGRWARKWILGCNNSALVPVAWMPSSRTRRVIILTVAAVSERGRGFVEKLRIIAITLEGIVRVNLGRPPGRHNQPHKGDTHTGQDRYQLGRM